jgi:hypothetical protein
VSQVLAGAVDAFVETWGHLIHAGLTEDDGADADVAEEVAFVAYDTKDKSCRVDHHTSTIRLGTKKRGQYTHNIPGAMAFGEAAPEQTWVEGEEASQLVDVFLDGGWTNQAKDHR